MHGGGTSRSLGISSCRALSPRAKQPLLVNRARSSAGEHLPDTEGVTGSIPVAPTSPSNEPAARLALTAAALVSMAAKGDAAFDQSHPPAPMRHCTSKIQTEAIGDDRADNRQPGATRRAATLNPDLPSSDRTVILQKIQTLERPAAHVANNVADSIEMRHGFIRNFDLKRFLKI
jgi:hypothetical protein